MKPRDPTPDQIMAELRRLRARGDNELDRLALLHEVSVYQEELLAQNDALKRSQSTLEESRDRFIELYDFAPTGYLTLDRAGVIRQCNLTAASIFGRSKTNLEGVPLLRFVAPKDRTLYFDFLRRCRTSGPDGCEVELTLHTGDGSKCFDLRCRPKQTAVGARQEFLMSVIDVTDRKLLVREREQFAVERAMLAGRLIAVQDLERTRIARDLHDDIGQEVTALRLLLELMAAETSPEAVRDGVARAQQMLATLDRRLHFVASELRPAALDLGIVAALDQFAEQWASSSGIPVSFHSVGIAPGTMTPDAETHVYRITQEALNNISKHAAASHVKITLEQQGDTIDLSIRDDGRGFDPKGLRVGDQGLGLAGMRERADLMGARLEVQSGRRGTVVRLQLPLAGGGG